MANPENKQIPYESTQKDIRDAIESVATAIGGIAIPSADHVSYDNSVSGLSATDVQNAIDELSSEKVDKEAGKGLSTNDYTDAEKTKLAGIEAGAEVNPTSSAKTATESFETVDGGLLSKCQINLVPVQSGSGDPYPAGGGKNKLNPTGTSQTVSDLVVVKNADGTFNISGGNSSSQVQIALIGEFTITNGESYRLSGCPTGGGLDSYRLDVRTSPSTLYGSNVIDNGNGVNFTASEDATLYVYARFYSNYSISGTLHFEPMIIKGTTPTSYAPYSNVRPISGHTEVDLYNVGKNLFDYTQATEGYRIGTKNGTPYSISNFSISPFIIVEPEKTYTLNFVYWSSADYGMAFYDTNKTYISGTKQKDQPSDTTFTFTTPSGCRFVRFTIYNGDTNNNSVQMEKGSTSTAFEPFNPSSHLYQVQIGSTVYGGYVDLVSGVMIPNIAKKVVSANDITNSPGVFAGRHFTNANYIPNPETARLSFWCNAYKAISASSSEEVGEVYISASGQLIFNTMYADINDFKTWINNNELYICYQIENPTPIQLTPQQIEALVGENNLSTPLDGQSIETNGVEYKELFTFADVKEYVDKKIPDAPTTDGTYTLQAVVSGGVPTYSWV